jgi:fatty-acyl-CoA synthase
LLLQAKVVDATGKMVPFGTPGELLIRGYLNMLGYWGEDDKTKEMIGPDRWVKTGCALNRLFMSLHA